MNRPGVQGHGAPARTVGAAIAALRPPARQAHATGRSAGLAQASTRHPPSSSPANGHAGPGVLEAGGLGSGRGQDP